MARGASTREELVQLLQDAVSDPSPERRLQAVRSLSIPYRCDDARDLDGAVVATLVQVAHGDENAVLVETALEALLPYPAEQAWQTWRTLAFDRPAVTREHVQALAHRLAAPRYAQELVSSGAADVASARLLQGRRSLDAAISMAERFSVEASPADGDAARALAERALVNLEDAGSVAAARDVLQRVAR